MVLENVSRYDSAALMALSTVACKTVQRRRYLLRRGFLLGMGTLCLACGVLLLFLFRYLDTSERLICAASLLMGLLALSEGLFYRRLLARSARRALRESGEEREYLFTGDFVQVNRQGVEAKYRYEALLGAYETAGHFVIFVDPRQGMVIDKTGFTRGSAEDLRSLLAEKLGGAVAYIA